MLCSADCEFDSCLKSSGSNGSPAALRAFLDLFALGSQNERFMAMACRRFTTCVRICTSRRQSQAVVEGHDSPDLPSIHADAIFQHQSNFGAMPEPSLATSTARTVSRS